MSSSAFQNFGPSWPMVVPSQAKAGEAIDPNGAWLLGRARHTLSYSCMGTAANATGTRRYICRGTFPTHTAHSRIYLCHTSSLPLFEQNIQVISTSFGAAKTAQLRSREHAFGSVDPRQSSRNAAKITIFFVINLPNIPGPS